MANPVSITVPSDNPDIKNLVKQLNTNMGNVVNEVERTNNLSEVTELSVSVGENKDDITANANAIDSLEVSVLANAGNIVANATAITALEVTVDDPITGVNANSSAIDTLETEVSIIEGDVFANASSITALESTVNDPITGVSANATAVDSLETEVSVIDGEVTALASDVTTLTATVDGNSAAITTEATARATGDGFLEGSYGLQVQAGDVVTGMKITSSTGAGTDISDVTFNTLNFKLYNGSLGLAPFTVSGSDIAFTGNVTFSGVGTSELTNDAGFTDDTLANTANTNALARTLPSEVADAVNTNTTTINGSKITTGTISANEITANTITANEIINLGITTDVIATNAVTSLQTANNTSFNVTSGGSYNASSVSASNDSDYKALICVSFDFSDGSGSVSPFMTYQIRGNNSGALLGGIRSGNAFQNGKTTYSCQIGVTSVVDSQYLLYIAPLLINNSGAFVANATISVVEFKK